MFQVPALTGNALVPIPNELESTVNGKIPRRLTFPLPSATSICVRLMFVGSDLMRSAPLMSNCVEGVVVLTPVKPFVARTVILVVAPVRSDKLVLAVPVLKVPLVDVTCAWSVLKLKQKRNT
jgi:hypothetical protein